DERFVPGPEPQLDIVVWAAKADTLAESSRRAQEIFDRAAERDLHLALVHLPVRFLREPIESKEGPKDGGEDGVVTCLRSVLMKPEHLDWIEEIGERIRQAAAG
ncbi:MAG: aspartate aminotransferase family protein, partial [Acidobacteriaceae bacterium]